MKITPFITMEFKKYIDFYDSLKNPLIEETYIGGQVVNDDLIELTYRQFDFHGKLTNRYCVVRMNKSAKNLFSAAFYEVDNIGNKIYT